MEIWKQSIFENYEVSSYGRVRNKKTGTIRKNYKRPNGYIFFDCSGRQLGVHRIVAFAFLPNPDNLPFINHKDGNPSNNHVDNLEWITPKGNVRHSLKELSAGRKYRCVETGEIYNWFEMREKFGFTSHNALKCCLNKPRRTSHGFHWETLDNHMKIEEYVKEKRIIRESDGFVFNSHQEMARALSMQESTISIYKRQAIARGHNYFIYKKQKYLFS